MWSFKELAHSPRWPAWLPPPPSLIQEWADAAEAAAHIEMPQLLVRHEAKPHAIQAGLDHRWFVLGQTGSGKTRFTKRLIGELRAYYPWANLYILDSKGGDDFMGWPNIDTDDEPPMPIRASEGGGVQVWQPADDDLDAYNTWLGRILKARRPAVVYIDELSSLGRKTGASFCENLPKLLKQGRSLGISVIALSQEAAYIPRQTMNTATHLIRFRLQDEVDRRRAAKLLGHADTREPRGEHGFFYRRLNPPGPAFEYAGEQEFF